MEAGLSHLDGLKKQERARAVNNEFQETRASWSRSDEETMMCGISIYGMVARTRRNTVRLESLPVSGTPARNIATSLPASPLLSVPTSAPPEIHAVRLVLYSTL